MRQCEYLLKRNYGEKYEYRLKMAQIEKMPSMVMHSSPDSTAQSLFNIAQSALNPNMQY